MSAEFAARYPIFNICLLDVITPSSISFKHINAMVDKGADVNMMNCHGDTPLLTAIRMKNELAIRTLVFRGANINFSDDMTPLPLWLAVEMVNPTLVTMLIELGARISQPTFCKRHMGYDNLLDFMDSQRNLKRGETCYIFQLERLPEIADILIDAGHKLPRHPTPLTVKHFSRPIINR